MSATAEPSLGTNHPFARKSAWLPMRPSPKRSTVPHSESTFHPSLLSAAPHVESRQYNPPGAKGGGSSGGQGGEGGGGEGGGVGAKLVSEKLRKEHVLAVAVPVFWYSAMRSGASEEYVNVLMWSQPVDGSVSESDGFQYAENSSDASRSNLNHVYWAQARSEPSVPSPSVQL